MLPEGVSTTTTVQDCVGQSPQKKVLSFPPEGEDLFLRDLREGKITTQKTAKKNKKSDVVRQATIRKTATCAAGTTRRRLVKRKKHHNIPIRRTAASNCSQCCWAFQESERPEITTDRPCHTIRCIPENMGEPTRWPQQQTLPVLPDNKNHRCGRRASASAAVKGYRYNPSNTQPSPNTRQCLSQETFNSVEHVQKHLLSKKTLLLIAKSYLLEVRNVMRSARNQARRAPAQYWRLLQEVEATMTVIQNSLLQTKNLKAAAAEIEQRHMETDRALREIMVSQLRAAQNVASLRREHAEQRAALLRMVTDSAQCQRQILRGAVVSAHKIIETAGS